ncbi:PEP-dependent dihydroxyacetone kinase dihydroxyacetone-binding subunit DhaK [termite gut metagenome]|uniref:PEP-dependent dihydroxyacetone kinase dihydroxyacetone-binding subunit DhaK n=1 Tax=termite gut metagenome TaxID=433724 RepID=A0A5J4RL13_9ZZZZ
MKKIINAPDKVVVESMQGFASAHADLVKAFYAPNYITRANSPVKGKVALVSGGGSGHEPMHSGYIGYGMLDAACPGEVFTSPTPDQVLEASKAVNGGSGILHIVKNYTGDILNFDMAAELLKSEGIDVERVIVDDDVAVQNSLYTAGRRGVGATVLLEKITGGAAEDKLPLAKVAAIAQRVNDSARSMGVALTSCVLPAVGKPTFDLPEDEFELGIGIHGEPGRTRLKMESADKIATLMMEPILSDLPFKTGDEVLIFVNGMGGTPILELYILYRKALEIATNAGLKVSRNLVGSYMTSIDMAGASITLLKLDDELRKYWDAPVYTPGLRWGI